MTLLTQSVQWAAGLYLAYDQSLADKCESEVLGSSSRLRTH